MKQRDKQKTHKLVNVGSSVHHGINKGERGSFGVAVNKLAIIVPLASCVRPVKQYQNKSN